MSILAREITCAEGRIGILTLSSPQLGHRLSLRTIDEALAALGHWQDDPGLAAILLHGNDRAFCAGIDLRALHETLLLSRDPLPPYAESIFVQLGVLFHQLQTFPKPVLAWATGIAQGAGLGLLSACRYRLGTPSLRLSQPEALKGFCPGVGATWYLNRLPGNLGLFLALTGIDIEAGDAYRLGLIDGVVPADSLEPLIALLQQTRWEPTMAANDNRLHRLLKQFPRAAVNATTSPMAAWERAIIEDCGAAQTQDVLEALQQRADEDSWFTRVKENLRRASPVSCRLIHEQLRRGRSLSLTAMLRMEIDLIVNCLKREEAVNGIWSSLNPDKGPPNWSYTTPADIPEDWVASHFESPWPEAHPLAAL